MTSTKRILSIIAIVAIVVSMLSVFTITASAATGKSNKYNVFTSKTITIKTEKSGSPYITFESIGNASYSYGAKPAILSLKVYNHSTRKTEWLRVTGYRSKVTKSVSSKLSLKRNTTYTVTIGYIWDKNINYGKFMKGLTNYTGWYEGQWRIKKTNRLNYSIK